MRSEFRQRTEENGNAALSFPVTQPAEGHLRPQGAGARLRIGPGRSEQGGATAARVPGGQPVRPVPVLVDGDLRLPESHGILAYLGEKTGQLWPASPAGRADALKWLFFLSQHIMPAAGAVALRIRAKVLGIPLDEATVVRGEKALPAALAIVEDQLTKTKWLIGAEFSLVDCAYCPVLNV